MTSSTFVLIEYTDPLTKLLYLYIWPFLFSLDTKTFLTETSSPHFSPCRLSYLSDIRWKLRLCSEQNEEINMLMLYIKTERLFQIDRYFIVVCDLKAQLAYHGHVVPLSKPTHIFLDRLKPPKWSTILLPVTGWRPFANHRKWENGYRILFYDLLERYAAGQG